jgi:hypothetical protein
MVDHPWARRAELRTPFTRKWKKCIPGDSSTAVTAIDHAAWRRANGSCVEIHASVYLRHLSCYIYILVVVVVYNCIIFDIVFHHNSICILIMIIYDYCIYTYASRWHGTLQNLFLVLVLTHPPILKFDPNTLW